MKDNKKAEVKKKSGLLKRLSSMKNIKLPGREDILKLAGISQPEKKQIKRKPVKRIPMKKEPLQVSNTNYRKTVEFYEQQRTARQIESVLKNRQLSESAKQILSRLMRTQNAGLEARNRIARIQREKKIISEAGNILKTPSIFSGKQDVDITPLEVPELNPTKAENLFSQEKQEQNRIKPRSLSILQTKEAGNDLKFF